MIMNTQHELARLNEINVKSMESVECFMPYSDTLFEVHDLIKKKGSTLKLLIK